MDSYKIWNLVDPEFAPTNHSLSPEGLNYKTGLHIRLHKRPVIVSGQLIRMDYFCHYDGSDFADLVVSVEFNWIRDATTKQLVKREGTISWTTVDSTDGEPKYGQHVKQTEKYYDARTAALADSRRRRNIIDEALALVGFLASNVDANLLGYVQTMLRSLDDEVNTYVNTNDRKLVEKISTYSGQWLETDVYGILSALGKQDIFEGITLRQALMGTLNYSD